MFNHRPLTLCVGLACATLCLSVPASFAATSRADHLAEISSYRDQARWLDALAAIERARVDAPNDDLLYRLQVLTLSDIGNAHRAWKLYQARPDLFDDAQKQRFEANYLAKRVGWSLAYGASEDTRLDEAEDALAQMERYLQRDGLTVQTAPLRIRYDRLILLNRLGRHEQLRTEYRALLAEGHEVPNYLLAAVGDSLMAGQHPDEAIPVLEAALKADPGRSEVHSELAYAHLESERADTAIDVLTKWQAQEPAWRWANGARAPYANWPRYEADLNLSMIRAYSGDLPTAQRDLEKMVELAPANGGTQSSLGNVYMMRGWPRRALERYSMANTLDPRDVSARLGQYDAYVELQRDDLARPIHDSLLERYPNQPSVQRMDRSWIAGDRRPLARGQLRRPPQRDLPGTDHPPAADRPGHALPLRAGRCRAVRQPRQRPYWRHRPERRLRLAVQRPLACGRDRRTQRRRRLAAGPRVRHHRRQRGAGGGLPPQ